MRRKHLAECWGIAVLAMAAVPGCWHFRPFNPRQELAPPVFAAAPTRDDVIREVNNNSQRVFQLQTYGARLTVPGLPPLGADLAFKRPRNLRLKAMVTRVTGPVLDMGSNQELMWLWAQSDPQPAVYYVRHSEFTTSAARQMLPVEPYWLVEALGLVYLDPAGEHEGPFPRGPGEVELRSRIMTSAGPVQRTLVVDDRRGTVKRLELRGANGILAASQLSDFQFYPSHGVSLPRRVDIQLAPGSPRQLAFRIDVGGYQVNSLNNDTPQLWALPDMADYPLVNLADPRMVPAAAPPVRTSQWPSHYRGF